MDAASVVIYAVFAVFLAVGLGVEGEYVWSGVAGLAAIGLAGFAVSRARDNVIGWSHPEGD